MRTFTAFRTALHTALFFSAASLTGVFAECIPLPFAVAAALLLLGLIAVEFDKPGLRLLVLAPAALCLLLTKGLVPAAVAAVPIIYTALMIGLGRFEMERRLVLREMKLCLFAVLVFSAVTFFLGWSLKGIVYRAPEACAYSSLVFLFCAFLFCFIALRTHRAGLIRSNKWQAGNIGLFLLPVAAGGAAGIFTVLFVIPVVKYVFFGISTGFMVSLIAGSQLLTKLFEFGKDITYDEASTPPPEIEPPEWLDATKVHSTKEPYVVTKRVYTGEINYGLIALIIAAVIVCVVVFLLIRRAASVKREYSEDVKREYLPDDRDKLRAGRKRRRRGKSEDRASKVRYVYRRYLFFLRTHGVDPTASDTSGDITERSAKLIAETDEELRELYRRARYDSEEHLTDEDVKRAEAAFERISSDENLIKNH